MKTLTQEQFNKMDGTVENDQDLFNEFVQMTIADLIEAGFETEDIALYLYDLINVEIEGFNHKE